MAKYAALGAALGASGSPISPAAGAWAAEPVSIVADAAGADSSVATACSAAAAAEETIAEEAVEEAPSDLDTGVNTSQSSAWQEYMDEAQAELAASVPEPQAEIVDSDEADAAPDVVEEAIPAEPAPLPEPVTVATAEPLPTEDVFGTGQELILLGPTNLTTDIIAQNDVSAALTITGASGGRLPEALAELPYQQLEDGPLYHEDNSETILALYEALEDQLSSGMAMTLEQTDDPYGAAYVLLIP